MLHPQVGQITVDALEGVLFKYAGQMLPAGVGVARQLCNIQLGVCVVRLQVGNRSGNQQACGGGWRCGAAAVDHMAEQQNQLGHLTALDCRADRLVQMDGLRHPLQQATEIPLYDRVGIKYDRLALQKAVGQAALRPGAVPDAGRDLHDKPFRGVRRDVELAGMEHLPGKEDQLPQMQVVDAAADGIPHTAARYRQDQLIVGVRVYDRLAVELVGVPCYHDIAALQG